jgi:hypothetical protein
MLMSFVNVVQPVIQPTLPARNSGKRRKNSDFLFAAAARYENRFSFYITYYQGF